jgi:hypothetical protein
LPIGRGVFPTPIGRESRRIFLRLPKNRVHDGRDGALEKLTDLPPSVRVRAAHEALPNEGDVDRCHDIILLGIIRESSRKFIHVKDSYGRESSPMITRSMQIEKQQK